MEKLKFSMKLLSEIPRNLSSKNSLIELNLCNSLFDSVSVKHPKPLFRHSAASTESHSNFSHIRFKSSPSWRSHHSVSEKFQGVLTNPVFLKQVFSNTHLKIRSLNVFDRGVLFMRGRFPRHRFEINRAYVDSWWRHWRSFFPTADNVVLGLIGANVAVFMLWRVADPTFMMKHFMVSVDNFTSGRVHTLITSAFSHMRLEHLFSNMIGLYFFGTTIGQIFGPEFMLKLYLAGAVGGSILYLIHHAFMASSSSKVSGVWYMDPLKIPGLGASGAVNAIMLLDIFLFPKAIHYVNFFIPVPAMLLGAFLIGKDVLRMKQGDSQISGSAHLGGAVVAVLAWARIRKGWI